MTDRFREVTKDELLAWVKAYPRPLDRDLDGTCDPHRLTFNDFAVAPKWPESVVAYFYVDWGPGHPEQGYRVLVEIPEVAAPALAPDQPDSRNNGHMTWGTRDAGTEVYYANNVAHGYTVTDEYPFVALMAPTGDWAATTREYAGKGFGGMVSGRDDNAWMRGVTPAGYEYDLGYMVSKKPDRHGA